MDEAKEYMTCVQAAQLLSLSPRTLEKFRVQGSGPVFRKFGRRVIYSRRDLEYWAQSRQCVSTSDANYRRRENPEVAVEPTARRSRGRR
jgi:hypothetical protein